jgi:YjgF/chorismate_mutase-like, putative endoribonuclease
MVMAVTRVEQRLADLGLVLPPEPKVPPNVKIPFQWVRVRGVRAFVSGHGALSSDGAPQGPFGPVASQVSLEQAQDSARSAVLSILASLQRTLGDLDTIGAWLTLSAFVNADPGYEWTTMVLNPASELLLDLFGPDAGAHARTAPGVTALPFNLPVICAAEVEIASS